MISNLIHTSSYIDGAWVEGGGDTFNVLNPATGELVSQIKGADAEDTINAVTAATRALPKWRTKSAKERSNILRRWYELIIKNSDDLASLLTQEQGKPLAEAKGEVIYGANFIEWFAEEAKRVYGDTIPAPNSNTRIVVIKQGIGVVSAITPWNFPNAMLTRKAAPALAAGCTFIVKAASETPLSALALAQLAEEAGIPKGVFNVVAGKDARAIGEVLTSDPRIAKFSFTGSTEVGRVLLQQCAPTVKKTSMELGGNAPFIVFNDADLDEAVKGALISKFRNAGQTCVCTNRIFVQSDIQQMFTEKLCDAVNQFKLGDGLQPQIDIGPLINTEAANSVKQMVDEAINAGAKLETGGRIADYGDHFFEPTVITKVTPDMRIVKEESFGPVAPIVEFETEEEVIKLANDTEVGLASYLYTRDIGRVWRVSEALEFGMIGINEGLISNEMAPFGGVKQSGMGREGSKYGLDDYLEIKYLCMGGIENSSHDSNETS